MKKDELGKTNNNDKNFVSHCTELSETEKASESENDDGIKSLDKIDSEDYKIESSVEQF